MKKMYVEVIVNEGGADFMSYSEDQVMDIMINETEWQSKETNDRIREDLRNAEIGTMMDVDGCSTVFVLKDDGRDWSRHRNGYW